MLILPAASTHRGGKVMYNEWNNKIALLTSERKKEKEEKQYDWGLWIINTYTPFDGAKLAVMASQLSPSLTWWQSASSWSKEEVINNTDTDHMAPPAA